MHIPVLNNIICSRELVEQVLVPNIAQLELEWFMINTYSHYYEPSHNVPLRGMLLDKAVQILELDANLSQYYYRKCINNAWHMAATAVFCKQDQALSTQRESAQTAQTNVTPEI